MRNAETIAVFPMMIPLKKAERSRPILLTVREERTVHRQISII
jgi:hypothetical protein